MRAARHLLIAMGAMFLLYSAGHYLLIALQWDQAPGISHDDPVFDKLAAKFGQRLTADQVIEYHRAPANWAGDREQLMAIQLDEGQVTRLLAADGWTPINSNAAADLEASLRFIKVFTDQRDWFPDHTTLARGGYLALVLSSRDQHGGLDALEIAFLHPASRTLYLVDVKL